MSTRSCTWCRCKRHSLATRMSYMYICHYLQVQVWLSARSGSDLLADPIRPRINWAQRGCVFRAFLCFAVSAWSSTFVRFPWINLWGLRIGSKVLSMLYSFEKRNGVLCIRGPPTQTPFIALRGYYQDVIDSGALKDWVQEFWGCIMANFESILTNEEALKICLVLIHVVPPLFTVTPFLTTPTNNLAVPSPALGVCHCNKRNSREQNFTIVFASISTGPTFCPWE